MDQKGSAMRRHCPLHDVEATAPLAIEIAELAVAVSVGVSLAVLVPLCREPDYVK